MVVYGMTGLTDRKQARELLALAAREVWGLAELPEMHRAPGGKPFFAGRAGMEFNLSHSGPLALCALDTFPVGADIQVVKNWRPGLAERIFTARELDWLAGQEDSGLAFAQLWALKESRAKYTGKGILPTGAAVRAVSVPLPAESSCMEWDGLFFRLYRGEDWAAAVCGNREPPEEIRWKNGEENFSLQFEKSLL